jgi:hypothetical protein
VESRGWDGAAKEYEERRIHQKRNYMNITGVDWGSERGGSWEPVWPNDGMAVTRDRAQLDNLLQKAVLDAENGLKNLGVSEHKRDRFNELKNKHLSDVIEKLNIDLAEQNSKEATSSALLSALKSQSAANVQICPCCNANLVVDANGVIIKADAMPQGKSGPEHVRAINAQELRVKDAVSKAAQLRARITEHVFLLEEQSALEKELATQSPTTTTREQVAQLNATVKALKLRLELLDKIEQERNTDQMIRIADTLHKLLIPSGVRQAKLDEKLASFNEMINQGNPWGEVRVMPDLSVRYKNTSDFHDYHWISTSEQFRVNVLIQVAIAKRLKDRWIILDNAEVLHYKHRSELFQFLHKSGVKAIVALMAKEPSAVPDLLALGAGCTTWVENGVAKAWNRQAASV